jgi:hypothetical protein
MRPTEGLDGVADHVGARSSVGPDPLHGRCELVGLGRDEDVTVRPECEAIDPERRRDDRDADRGGLQGLHARPPTAADRHDHDARLA